MPIVTKTPVELSRELADQFAWQFPVRSEDAVLDREPSKNIIEESQTGARKILSVALLDGLAQLQKAA
jgi:hypothetical protein